MVYNHAFAPFGLLRVFRRRGFKKGAVEWMNTLMTVFYYAYTSFRIRFTEILCLWLLVKTKKAIDYVEKLMVL